MDGRRRTAVVLGGAGAIGAVAARGLAVSGQFDEVVVADRAAAAAAGVARSLGPAARAVEFDAASGRSVRETVDGAAVAVNCVGPFYRFGPPILDAVIAAGVPYVDVCDDLDATVRMLDLDGAARAAGVTAVIGMGNSPGLANVFVRLCAKHFLDVVESVDIMHVHGGEPDEGPGVLKHRIHAMVDDVPLFVDGEFRSVRMLEDSGRAFVRETEFRDVGTLPVFPYPHPETITLPRHLPGLRRATNLGVVFPLTYFEMTIALVRAGMGSEEPVRVDGHDVAPVDVAVALLRARRPQLLADAGVTGPAGCLKVVVGGTKDGAAHTYVLSLSSSAAGAGEGTGIPAALGAVLLDRGRVPGPGVLPPEAAVDPDEMLALAADVVPHFGMGGGLPLHLEHVDATGARAAVPFTLA